MKKFVLSIFVILTFTLYSFQQSHEGENAKVQTPAITDTPTSSGNSPTPSNMMQNKQMMRQGQYKDGNYTGIAADAFYGNIQVQAVISNGKISNVIFLEYPNDRQTSIEINTQAMPYLKQEAIQAQNAQVDIVSGATDSSLAFIQSLGNALTQAH